MYYKELTKYLESQYTSNSTNIIVEEFGKGGDVLSIMFDENVDEKSWILREFQFLLISLLRNLVREMMFFLLYLMKILNPKRF